MLTAIQSKLENIESKLQIFLPNILNEEEFKGKMWNNIYSEFVSFYGEQLTMRHDVKELLFNLSMISRGTTNEVTLNNTKEHCKSLRKSLNELTKLYRSAMGKFSGRINNEVNEFLDNFKKSEISSLAYDVEKLILESIGE